MLCRHSAIPAALWQEIQARLERIEACEGIRILFAVESGSRAWGFPSPDSDFDVRFVYVRERDWYLRLQPGRDVIETPIEDEIDLNGWDLRKALALMLKSNAVIGEWMASPIIYRLPHPIVSRLSALADDVLDGRGLAYHYANLGKGAAERWLEGDGPVPVKRYFYALRPVLAIRCLRFAPKERPPMHLSALLERAALDQNLIDQIAWLVDAKSRAKEASPSMRFADLDELIRSELNRATEIPGRPGPTQEHHDEADRLFLDIVNI